MIEIIGADSENCLFLLSSSNFDKIIELIQNMDTRDNALFFLGTVTETTNKFSSYIGSEQFFNYILQGIDNFESFSLKLLFCMLCNICCDVKLSIQYAVQSNFVGWLLHHGQADSNYFRLLYIISVSDSIDIDVLLNILNFFSFQIQTNPNPSLLKYPLYSFYHFLTIKHFKHHIIHLIITNNLCPSLIQLVFSKKASIISLDVLKLSLIISPDEIAPQVEVHGLLNTICSKLQESNEDIQHEMIQIITAYTNGTNSFPQIFSSFDFIQLFLNGSVRIKTVLLQLFCAIYQYAEPIFFSPEFGESLFDMLGSLDHINKKILYQLISILLYRIDEEEQANFILEKAMEVEFMETLNNDCLSENDDLAECANELLKLITTDSDNE